MGSPFHSVSILYLNFCFWVAMTTEADTKRDNKELKLGLCILRGEGRLVVKQEREIHLPPP